MGRTAPDRSAGAGITGCTESPGWGMCNQFSKVRICQALNAGESAARGPDTTRPSTHQNWIPLAVPPPRDGVADLWLSSHGTPALAAAPACSPARSSGVLLPALTRRGDVFPKRDQRGSIPSVRGSGQRRRRLLRRGLSRDARETIVRVCSCDPVHCRQCRTSTEPPLGTCGNFPAHSIASSRSSASRM